MTKRKGVPLENWLTPTQAADLLGITQRHVTWLCERGELECRKIVDRWLIHPQSIEDWTPKRRRRKKDVSE